MRPTQDHGIDIRIDDAHQFLRTLPDNHLDAIITDPPYEIDYVRQLRNIHGGHEWDATGIACDASFWAEALRAAKPGANLLAFAAPRTVHRIAVAIEEAGWELRDQVLVWMKSYGFPKKLAIRKKLASRGRSDLAERYEGIGNVLKPSYEPIIVARKAPIAGGLVENLIHHGIGGLGIDACRIPTDDDRSRPPGISRRGDTLFMQRGTARSVSHAAGRYPGNLLFVHDEHCTSETGCAADCHVAGFEHTYPGKSKFFPAFYYSGRASKAERPVVDGIEHPTIKPVALMEWLVALGAPAAGMLVLDPFAGTGSTGLACARLGRRAMLVENNERYLPLLNERLRTVLTTPRERTETEPA